jgi:hypothetical protein
MGLTSVENFSALIELQVIESLDLERITNLPRLQKLTITHCPKLKVLEGVPALQRLMIKDGTMEILPEYMAGLNPRRLELHCSLGLLAFIAAAQSGPEWDKFCHVEHVKAYAREGDNPRKWYVLYTTNPYNLETNVSCSAFMCRGKLAVLVHLNLSGSFIDLFSSFIHLLEFVYVPYMLIPLNTSTDTTIFFCKEIGGFFFYRFAMATC